MYKRFGKRIFDYCGACFLLLLCWPIILCSFIISSLVHHSSGFFLQERVGQYGHSFIIYKIKSIHPITKEITNFGRFLRRSKIDELPQLLNIIKGEMSFVGPRPDVPGYYDTLKGDDRRILELKPGITSEASIKYRHEEQLLAEQIEPLKYNDEVIFPDKVRMNLDYLNKMSFSIDLKIIFRTLF